ncbi:MAG: tRNA(Met) cytidine acetyltransferase [Gammaproteobacteria bacterium]|nr:tRNA(Met) cytidine acetyltransferase [Gammaproteobacteria bacterium]
MTASAHRLELESLLARFGARRWRLPVLVQGSHEQCLRWCVDCLPVRDVLWVSKSTPSGGWQLPPGKANHELGREADCVVVDLFDGLNVDTLAAVAGMVRAGGCLVLLGPPLEQWGDFPDPEYDRIRVEPFAADAVRRHFLTRLARRLAMDARVARVICDGGAEWPLLVEAPVADQPADESADAARWPDDLGCAHAEQRAAVDAILQVAQGHRRRPLVLQADRGRGKSAALGIAAGILLQEGKRIIITAPRPESVECLRRFARRGAGSRADFQLTFIAPDLLSQSTPEADLVLVDEAAAIAPVLLQGWLRRYSRMVFATTVQGYEGTGRGFAIRFAQSLDQLAPGWKKRELNQPVRWDAGDPLEAALNDLLLLDACSETVLPEHFSGIHQQPLEEITPHLGELPDADLRALFGLLVSAHYRTRPGDLRTLMDGPNVRTFVLRGDGAILAVVMVADEGGLPADLRQGILDGKRRPHGHVLPQTLAVHLNVADALVQRSWRVVRIAVHSQARRLGIGRACLVQLEALARQENVALLGSLFAASADVLAFWQSCGFSTLRVGITPEATSGSHPVLVARALNEPGAALLAQARQRFEHTFLTGLADSHPDLPASLVLAAWGSAQQPAPCRPDTADQLDLQHFIAGHKTYENAAAALWRYLHFWLHVHALHALLKPEEQTLLVGKILQKQPWDELAHRIGYSGVRDARERLRKVLQRLQAELGEPR